MKRKDIVTIVVSTIILIVAMAFIYRIVVPPPKDSGIKVIVPRPVKTELPDQKQMSALKDDKKIKDFSQELTPDANATPKPVIN